MNRRALLTTTGLGLTAALAACASLTPATVQTQLQTDTAALAAALQTIPALLAQAGWTVKDGQLENAKGDPFRFELLLDQPEFERVVLPFAQNLARLGIAANVRTIDPAQYENRMQNFDFDMTVVLYPESLSPGNEQRDYWTAASGKSVGGRNLLGIASPAVDDLVEQVVNAPDRLSLVNRVHALDRVLLEGYYVIPNWHFPYFRVASWDKFSRPAVAPPYGLAIDTWWVDPAKAAALDAKRP